ncbi:MAG: rhomboid family intramembrane serine protease [Methanotrichaceae archaeon]|nr:rhomboid family intramembrane serine protease [Methanotrichaceae archaeon]
MRSLLHLPLTKRPGPTWVRTDAHWDDDEDWRAPRGGLPVSVSGAILIICMLFYVATLIAPGIAIPYLALNPALVLERPWTMVTHMFMHASFDHLFWNMLFLFFFGMELERRVGERLFLEIYLTSGLVAAFCQIAISSGYMLGASGALYGVLGCLALIAPEIRVLLFFILPLRIQYAVVLFALMDFSMMGSGDSIAHMAHIGGLFVGLGFGYILRDRYRRAYL